MLHVEDDENDALLFARACEYACLPVRLNHVCDAAEAMNYLLGRGDFADRAAHPLPQIIILDLKLPGMDGFQFLKWLRGMKSFVTTPVLVFTSSARNDDKDRALAAGANSYFVKPASFDSLVEIVRNLNQGNRLN